jgi:PPK2 family polyphosphate:nucleotide phosphotransferase
MKFRDTLIVKPGKKVKLADIDPGFSGEHEDKKSAAPEYEAALETIDGLQEKLYAEKKHALLIVLQGIDAAGKDGVCWHVITAMNPQGCSVASFKQPSTEELAHDFLWRVHQKTPGRGQVAVFNRSHYEDVLIVRVHNLVPKGVWSKRYDQINAFEHVLAENDTTILKFFLYISKEEQLERFKKRLDDPDRQWKISASDYAERDYWDDYVGAYEDMLSKCSTEQAPWFVIPSNKKWFRNLAVSKIIAETMEGLKIQPPTPSVDIAEIHKKYHEAVAEEKKDGKG